MLLDNYAADHDGVYAQPTQFAEIFEFYGYEWPEPILGENQDDIWMFPIPWGEAKIPQDASETELASFPILHERESIDFDGTLVLYWDGSVRLLSNEEFAALIDTQDSVCLGCQFVNTDQVP